MCGEGWRAGGRLFVQVYFGSPCLEFYVPNKKKNGEEGKKKVSVYERAPVASAAAQRESSRQPGLSSVLLYQLVRTRMQHPDLP